MKRRARSASIVWRTILSFAQADELSDICDELRELVDDINSKKSPSVSVDTRTLPTSLKIASDGGCQVSDDEKNKVAHQLRDAGGPAHIDIANARLLVQLVGSAVSNYPPGGDDVSFISSVESLTPYLTAARTALCPPTSARRVPLIP